MKYTTVHTTAFKLAISGAARTGKTTLGWAISRATQAPVVDLDSVTNPLLDCLPRELFGSHWLAAPPENNIRNARYAALRATARDILLSAKSVIVVAPFTQELQGGETWGQLTDALGVDLPMVHLVGSPTLIASRKETRGAERDKFAPRASSTLDPKIPHVSVDAALDTPAQVRQVLQALGCPES